MRIFLFSLMGIFMLMTYGCYSVRESSFKNEDLYGVWTGKTYGDIAIYTPTYELFIMRKAKYPCIKKSVDSITPPSKYKYEVIKDWGIWIKSVSTGKLKQDSKGLYLDYIPYWLGIIPMDNIAIMRKMSD